MLGAALFGAGPALPVGLTRAKKKKKKHHHLAPVSPVPPSPPVCKQLRESCNGGCCSGLTCGPDFCGTNQGDTTACFGNVGASCTDPCECAVSDTYCQG